MPPVPPFFGSRGSESGSRSGSGRGGGGSGRFGAPPFFGSGQTGPSQRRQQQQPQRARPSPNNGNSNPYNLLGPGTRVVARGLVGATHLNGRAGTVLRYRPEIRRYDVKLDADISDYIATGEGTAPVAMRPENLLQTAKVKVRGLRSQPNLNGKQGTVVGYSPERGRYVVRVDSGLLSLSSREVSLRPSNFCIPDGTCVRLEGLRNAPHWNGKYGTVAGWVEGEGGEGDGRYQVSLSRQYAVLVRMENVML